MSSIVLLKSGALLDSEAKAKEMEWKCPTIEGGTLHQNGFQLSESVRRLTDRRKEEKENAIDLGEETNASEEEERGLKNRVWSLEEEKCKLHKDLAAMTLKETILRDKVREFELQMDGHRKRVERAERTIIELRQALAQSNKQARQAETQVEELRLLCARNDGEKQDMQNRVERLQQLCLDHEKSIHGLRQGLKNGMDGNKEGKMSRLQKELQRLSGVEISLRTDLEASRVENATLLRDMSCLLERFANQQRETATHMKKVEQELRAEIDRGQAKASELQDENNILFAKLRLLTRERQDTREALRSCNDRVADLEEDNQSLQEEISKMESALEAKQMDIQNLEYQLERSNQNKEVAETALVLKENVHVYDLATTAVKDSESRNSSNLGTEMRQSLHSMNERVESLLDKLAERDFQLQEARVIINRKDEVVAGLEHTLNNLAKTVDSQSSRIMRLSKQNEDLTRATMSQTRQIEDLQAQVANALDSKKKEEEELDGARKRLEEYDKHFESQSLTCQLLQERVDALQADLQHSQPQMKSLMQQRDELASERQNLHHSLTDATLRVTDLEHRLTNKEESIQLQQVTLEELRKKVDEGREELNRVKHERDEMQREAEALSREALRTSVEVEVLRRRVHQLDEDVLLRDGQICILRGNLEDL